MAADVLDQTCNHIEAHLADSEFLRQVHWRVARVVNHCVANALNPSKDETQVSLYASLVGQGLRELWKQICGDDGARAFERWPGFRALDIPSAALYINSLGVRWGLLAGDIERKYKLRVVVYLGAYFDDGDLRDEENKYNDRVFQADSPHLVSRVCRSKNPPRLVVGFESGVGVLKDDQGVEPGGRYQLVTVPEPGDLTALEQASAAALAYDHSKVHQLEDALPWITPALRKEIAARFRQAGVEDVRKDNVLQSILNLYRLRQKLLKRHNITISHVAYLPDPVFPNLHPAGFSGPVALKGSPITSAKGYARLLRLLQSFFSKGFLKAVEAAEAATVQVSFHRGLSSEETWSGMFIHERPGGPTPREMLLGGFLDVPPARHSQSRWNTLSPTRPRNYDDSIQRVRGIVRDCFVQLVAPDRALVGSPETAATERLQPNDTLATILAGPAIGYDALARAAYGTIEALWTNLWIVNPKGWTKYRQREEALRMTPLDLVHHLLFFEPSLHYIESYRDHFLHSFNVLLLGYWLLQLERSPGNYFLFPERNEDERTALLRQWTVLAPLHDIAYPLEKLSTGSSELFERMTRNGVTTLDGVKLSSEWWAFLHKWQYYRFLHQQLREATKEDFEGKKQDRPLFHLRTSKKGVAPHITSTELVARLLELVALHQNHGIWGALILQNHLHKKDPTDNRAIRRTGSLLLDPNEEQDICIAMAFHHIYDILDTGSKKQETDEHEKDDQEQWWLDRAKHPLAFLLILCDSLCQWGRTRKAGNAGESDAPRPTSKKEKVREAKLFALDYQKDKNRVLIRICYPNLEHKKIEAEVRGFFRRPLRLLQEPNGLEVGITLTLHGHDGTEGREINEDDGIKEWV